jgi:hypothetical protein
MSLIDKIISRLDFEANQICEISYNNNNNYRVVILSAYTFKS